MNPLRWIFGHKEEGCLCDGNTCASHPGVYKQSVCPAEHCRRLGCGKCLLPGLPQMRVVR